ncbi:MAG: hypothetical protein E7Z91_04080 [Cyanobacteria bacterium SIG30]|nr:hypothetical protein [Cyanobacteria bacterium SIG30]
MGMNVSGVTNSELIKIKEVQGEVVSAEIEVKPAENTTVELNNTIDENNFVEFEELDETTQDVVVEETEIQNESATEDVPVEETVTDTVAVPNEVAEEEIIADENSDTENVISEKAEENAEITYAEEKTEIPVEKETVTLSGIETFEEIPVEKNIQNITIEVKPTFEDDINIQYDEIEEETNQFSKEINYEDEAKPITNTPSENTKISFGLVTSTKISNNKKENDEIEENVSEEETKETIENKEIKEGEQVNNEEQIEETKAEEAIDEKENTEIEDAETVDLQDFIKLLQMSPKLAEIGKSIGYGELFDTLDVNCDGIISGDELKKLVGTAGSLKALEAKDIESLFKNQIDDYEKEISAEKETSKTDSVSDEETVVNEPVTTSSIYQPKTVSYTPSVATHTTTQVKEPTNADKIQELEKQKTEKTNELSSLNEDLQKVHNGSDEEIKAKQENVNKTKEEYDKACDSSKNPIVKYIKNKQDENEKAISENKTQIQEVQTKISENDQAIFEKESSITGLESNKSALQQSLSSIEATEENEYNKDKIASKKAELKKQIQTKENEINTAKEELEALKTQKSENDEKLKELQDKEQELQTTKENLAESMEVWSLNNDEIKSTLKAWQEAEKDLETTKQEKINSIQEKITATKTAITEIDAKINEIKAEEIKKQNQLKSSGMYDEKRGKALADAALELYGNDHVANGYCATGVSQAINKAFGYSTRGNGCDYANVLSNKEDWVEVTDEYPNRADLKNLPAGAIVSWSSSSQKPYGHVFISDGNGHEISDFTGNINYNYPTTYRVFLPA